MSDINKQEINTVSGGQVAQHVHGDMIHKQYNTIDKKIIILNTEHLNNENKDLFFKPIIEILFQYQLNPFDFNLKTQNTDIIFQSNDVEKSENHIRVCKRFKITVKLVLEKILNIFCDKENEIIYAIFKEINTFITNDIYTRMVGLQYNLCEDFIIISNFISETEYFIGNDFIIDELEKEKKQLLIYNISFLDDEIPFDCEDSKDKIEGINQKINYLKEEDEVDRELYIDKCVTNFLAEDKLDINLLNRWIHIPFEMKIKFKNGIEITIFNRLYLSPGNYNLQEYKKAINEKNDIYIPLILLYENFSDVKIQNFFSFEINQVTVDYSNFQKEFKELIQKNSVFFHYNRVYDLDYYLKRESTHGDEWKDNFEQFYYAIQYNQSI
jgi:hypothetical protein